MNRSTARFASFASLTVAGVALAAALGGCSVAREAQSNFDIGTSQAPRAQGETTQPGHNGQMLVASDSLGDQVFKDRSNDTAFASAPTE